MKETQIELLSPAGTYDIFLLAINSGADAVYFAGSKFGARAFAANFTDEEVIKAIHIAHLFNKKVYLTINTLLKELEIRTLYDFLNPFYVEGLDGVIVQDFGVLEYIKNTFPKLKLHASTQMTITGSFGIKFLETLNVDRVVLARELSLTEIKKIKEQTNMELEIFIHGAMCYAYSGQCLLSSILGGRSGNRGRCAQPCRLPYQVDGGKSQYPLSMKDQCALYFLEQLIDLGVTSLKIEGRMKKPEYVAKVTSIYRKYIDLIYSKRKKKDSSTLIIERKDLDILENLYVRNSLQDGYFKNQNSREMITMNESTYKETSLQLLEGIRTDIARQEPLKIYLECDVYLFVDSPVKLNIAYNNKKYFFEGDVVLSAKNQPLTEEKITNQIQKTQNTIFDFIKINVHTDLKSFLPLSSINSIRRMALKKIEDDILFKSKRIFPTTEPLKKNLSKILDEKTNCTKQEFSILISSITQLEIAVSFSPKRIYLPIELFETERKKINTFLENNKLIDFFLSLPYVFREKDVHVIDLWKLLLNNVHIKGVLIRNIEEVGFLENIQYSKIKQLDYFIYCINSYSISFWERKRYFWTTPLELNNKELKHLPSSNEAMVYGRIPLMISANCITKTIDNCKKNNQTHMLTDRMNKEFPTVSNCNFCYNVLYNSVPLSLHKYINSFKKHTMLRLEFTIEPPYLCENICNYYIKNGCEDLNQSFLLDYTNGHFNRGID